MNMPSIPPEFFKYAEKYGEYTITIGKNGEYDIITGWQAPWWASALPYILMVAVPIILALIILGIIFAVEKRKRK